MAAGLIFLPFIAVLALGLLAAFGTILSPVLAMVSGFTARNRKMDFCRYSLAGGVYSLLFVLPAVCLIARLHGKQLSSSMIVAVYVALFLSAITGPVGMIAILAGSSEYGSGDPNAGMNLVLISIIAILSTSAVYLVAFHGNSVKNSRIAHNILLHPAYLGPFAALYGSMIVMLLTVVEASPFHTLFWNE